MTLPFTIEQFLDVFVHYNTRIWPAQYALNGMALAIVALLVGGRTPTTARWVSALVAILWAWTGITYHWISFAPINPAAYLFGVLFLVQAGIFLWVGVARKGLQFQSPSRTRVAVSVGLIGYALVCYPLLGFLFGHRYPAAPTFGAPCPTVIFTVGVLFLLREPFPRRVLLIPILWAGIGGSAAFSLGVLEDYGLMVAGIAGIVLALLKPRRTSPGPAA